MITFGIGVIFILALALLCILALPILAMAVVAAIVFGGLSCFVPTLWAGILTVVLVCLAFRD